MFKEAGDGDDPLLAARIRGLKRKNQLLEASGGVLSAERIAETLGMLISFGSSETCFLSAFIIR
jgi:hypothetical protein